MVVWTGDTDLGKTTTARWMTEKVNQGFDQAPGDDDSYRALYYETGRIPRAVNNGAKRAIRSVYQQVLGTMDPGMYRQSPPHHLAELVVRGLERKQLEMLFVDEAGLLSISALRGMALLYDIAEMENWPLTIVLIGMDDLPQSLQAKRQLQSRVKQWVFFEAYEVEEVWPVLADLFGDHFEGPDDGDANEERVVELVCDLTGGTIGQIVPLVRRTTSACHRFDRELNTEAVREVWVAERRTEKIAVERAKEGWSTAAEDEDKKVA